MQGVTFALVLLSSVVPVCEGHCVDRFLLLEKSFSFYDARMRCQQLGYTDLAVLNTMEQSLKAIDYLVSRKSAGSPIYIGLYNTHGSFYSVNGAILGFTNWAISTGPNVMDANGMCVGMVPDDWYRWSTYDCNQKNVGEKRLPREASARFVLHVHDVDTTEQSMTPPIEAWSEEECLTLCLQSCPECMYFIHVNGTCRLFDDVTPSSLVILRAGARVFYKSYSE